jgi:hypothetical protein
MDKGNGTDMVNSGAERAEKEGVVIVAPLWPGTLDVSLCARVQ